MKFTKMHGAGNDYVYVDGCKQAVADPAALARAVSDRHFGVGGDGLILILPSAVAAVRMRIFNADGSEAEMCGNGLRCVAKYAYDHGLVDTLAITVETGAGLLPVEMFTNGCRAGRSGSGQHGAAALDRAEIPLSGSPEQQVIDQNWRCSTAPCASPVFPWAIRTVSSSLTTWRVFR